MLLCTRVILNFVMVEDEIVHESVGKVNETIPLHINIILSHSLSNVENVHQQCDNDVFDEVHFQTMELQLYYGSHITRLLYVGVFWQKITTYLLIL